MPTSEILEGYNPYLPDSPRRFSLEAQWDTVHWRRVGEEGLVATVAGHYYAATHESLFPMKLFLKRLNQKGDYWQHPDELAEKTLDVWSFLTANRLPTLPWIAYDKDKQALIMPDMSIDGSHILDTHTTPRVLREAKKHVTEGDKYFDPENPHIIRIMDIMKNMLETAYNKGHGYAFSHENVALIIPKDWDVTRAKPLFLDMGTAVRKIEGGASWKGPISLESVLGEANEFINLFRHY